MAHPRPASSPPHLTPTSVLILVLPLSAVLALLIALFLAFIFEWSSFFSMPGRNFAPPPHQPPPVAVPVGLEDGEGYTR